jgi:DNA-binding response OmpR family regulator
MDSKPHILIVDDDPSIRGSLSSFLGRAGFMVSTAPNGETALNELDKIQPDLLIRDVLMPRLDGRETLRRMRRSGNWMPVITCPGARGWGR